jgi:hypothetical protein
MRQSFVTVCGLHRRTVVSDGQERHPETLDFFGFCISSGLGFFSFISSIHVDKCNIPESDGYQL